MKSESLPAPTLSTEALWVEGELVRSLMRSQRNALWIGLVLTAVLVGLLWGDTALLPLVAWAMLAAGLIAVGTAVANGPPRRSQRALLTHWAPALGSGVEARFGPGMLHAGGR